MIYDQKLIVDLLFHDFSVTIISALLYIFQLQSNLCYASTYGKAKNWLLKTGAWLIQVNFHFFAFNGISYSGL